MRLFDYGSKVHVPVSAAYVSGHPWLSLPCHSGRTLSRRTTQTRDGVLFVSGHGVVGPNVGRWFPDFPGKGLFNLPRVSFLDVFHCGHRRTPGSLWVRNC